MIKRIALQHLHQYFREQDLQLLDQTIVLKSVWPRRSDFGSLQLRRRYVFEFTSTGEERYRGLIELSGRRVQRVELEPHLLADIQDRSQ